MDIEESKELAPIEEENPLPDISQIEKGPPKIVPKKPAAPKTSAAPKVSGMQAL